MHHLLDELGDDLLALEAALDGLLIEYERLQHKRLRSDSAVERAALGRELETYLSGVAEVQQRIAETSPRTLAEAAVQLRRLEACLDGKDELRLLTSALAVVETAAAEPAA